MERNYMLVYENKYSKEINHRYFPTLEDMKDFIRVNLRAKRYWKVLHKYEIKEVK